MNKNLLYLIALLLLVVLGFFALQKDKSPKNVFETQDNHSNGMQQPTEDNLETVKESVKIPFKKQYKLDDEWSLTVNQFEPNAKIMDVGVIASDSDQEQNPAVKVDFYKNGEFIHYQIVFKEAPGFHSIKQGQAYLLDFIDYEGFKNLGNNVYSINNATLKVWKIK